MSRITVGVCFCGVMAWRGFILAHQAREYGERVSSGFGTPLVFPYAMLPIGFGALAIQFLFCAFGAALESGAEQDAAEQGDGTS
ncbi:TRAP transporter small permease subunit [Pikeienuella piscinae]|uniref:TRAP transporter small permease subunit n=1 Tax=Pikeienuella piscinae TaxID=2748098 RepID=UPI001BA60F93